MHHLVVLGISGLILRAMLMLYWKDYRRLAQFLSVTLLGCISFGCTTPAYDATTDKAISTLQSDIDSELVSLASLSEKIEYYKDKDDTASKKALADAKAKASYESNSDAYDKIEVDLTTVRLRVDAAPDNSTPQLDEALKDLDENLFGEKSLRVTHRAEDLLNFGYINTEKSIVDQQLQALLTNELVLKKGNSN